MPNKKDEEDGFQAAMDEIHDGWHQEINRIAQELNIPNSLARDIWYLRGRSRWTNELEERILRCYRETGTVVNTTTGEETEELGILGY